jgi:hypothetical protein
MRVNVAEDADARLSKGPTCSGRVRSARGRTTLALPARTRCVRLIAVRKQTSCPRRWPHVGRTLWRWSIRGRGSSRVERRARGRIQVTTLGGRWGACCHAEIRHVGAARPGRLPQLDAPRSCLRTRHTRAERLPPRHSAGIIIKIIMSWSGSGRTIRTALIGTSDRDAAGRTPVALRHRPQHEIALQVYAEPAFDPRDRRAQAARGFAQASRSRVKVATAGPRGRRAA